MPFWPKGFTFKRAAPPVRFRMSLQEASVAWAARWGQTAPLFTAQLTLYLILKTLTVH